MYHELLPSIDDLLAPPVLTALLGWSVTAVHRAPLTGVTESYSGSPLDVVMVHGARDERLILKRISRAWDIMMRLTDDEVGREVLVWQTGLLDQLPSTFSHAYLACAVDDDGWAILMRDLTGSFVDCRPNAIASADNRRFVDAMAAFHATWWDRTEFADAFDGWCHPRHFYQLVSPRRAEQERASGAPVIEYILDGWDIAFDLVPGQLMQACAELADDPTPLCAALARYPQTMVHGDLRPQNMAVEQRQPSAITAIDWAYAGPGSAIQDLGWYLNQSAIYRQDSNETTIAMYRDSLAAHLGDRFDPGVWEAMLSVGLLGGCVRCACVKALEAVHAESLASRERNRSEFFWWVDRAQEGMAWL